jgi:putative MATE family efflux protein
MMTDKKEMLGQAPVGKLLFKLALPTVVAQLINMLYNIIDRIYIGHMPEVGDFALTGVGICMPVIMIVSAFAALVSSGGAPRASIFMGKKDIDSADRTLGSCFGLQIIVSLILTIVLLVWNRDFLLMFGASENTIGYAVEYMSIYAIGTIFVQLTLGMNAFITAQGFTKISMISVVVGAMANIILDPILIYGAGMGVKGAALATIISQALSCVWVLSFLSSEKSILRLRCHQMCFFNDIDLYRKIVRGDIDILSDLANGVNAKRCFVAAIDVNHVGRVAREDFAARGAPQARQGRMCILCVLARKCGGKMERQRVLAKATLT